MQSVIFKILLFFLLVLSKSTFGQDWPKIYGDNFNAYSSKIIEDYDHGYLVGGSVLANPNTFRYAWIIKTDINGIEIWDKKFGNEINQFYLSSCIKTANQGLVACGGSTITDSHFDPIFFKLNVCGETEWCKILLSPGYNVANDIITIEDGYIALLSYFVFDEQFIRMSLVKMDLSGEPIWIQKLAQEDTLINNEELGNLYLTNDQKYLLSGQCFHPGLKPYWIKTDTIGIQVWDLLWQGGTGAAYQVSESSNNFFYSVGSFAAPGLPFLPTLYKFDNDGNSINEIFLLTDTIIGGESTSICYYNDSTLLIGLIWGIQSNKTEEYFSEVLKTDTNGNIINRRVLLNTTRSPENMIKSQDGNILVVGTYAMDNNWDIYLWKMNSDLEDDTLYTQPIIYDSLCPYEILSDTVDLDCSLFVNIDEIPTKEEYESTIKISPNPASDWITLIFPENVSPGPANLAIYNLFGQEVISSKISPQNKMVSLNISNLPSGVYLVTCKNSWQKILKGKFVVVR